MMPGVPHCAGGAGPDRVDWDSVIDNWVEKGAAPERIDRDARWPAGKVTRTRPLCAYPLRAVYKTAADSIRRRKPTFTAVCRGQVLEPEPSRTSLGTFGTLEPWTCSIAASPSCGIPLKTRTAFL